jgi:hypothetical protein
MENVMRKHLMLSFVFIAVIGAAPATALDLPARKAGLWEITMTMEGATSRCRPPSTASMPRPTS